MIFCLKEIGGVLSNEFLCVFLNFLEFKTFERKNFRTSLDFGQIMFRTNFVLRFDSPKVTVVGNSGTRKGRIPYYRLKGLSVFGGLNIPKSQSRHLFLWF